MYAGPLFVISSILNVVAVSYGATAALPFGTIMVIVLLYAFLTIPLLVLGGVIGYLFRSEFQSPCATKRYPREIPPLPWYRDTPCQMFLGGFLPFSAIVLELQHLYASLWGYRIFTLPSILFIMFIILILITAILSVGLTYIQLSVVVEICVLWGLNRYFYVCLLYLLLHKVKHEWLIAVLICFRLQCLHVLCILLDAWHSRLPFFPYVRSLHLPSC
ncbi:hypothetical protein E1A91_A05G086700v1 [Gossypium mustelinum]|uniref:Transmembrane 9 superfamily member n=1 Tax=Gossypium mustelinum TaxID=34275 RepID=A0A5D2Z4Q7_GOSMU|nr:hypothetical protein E1A91_A05G086700v1 [Gossypium mustelinum]